MKAKSIGLLAVMAAMLEAPLGIDPIGNNKAPFENRFNISGKGFRQISTKKKEVSETQEKDRKTKRKISNHNRKINQAYARKRG